MKKKLLFLSLIGLLLAGCSFEDLMFWKKSEQPSQKEEPKEKDQGSDEEDKGSEDEGKQDEIPKEDIVDEQEYTATIKTSGAEFATLYPSGSHIDQHLTDFRDFLDDQLDYLNLITSVLGTKLDSFKWQSETYLKIGSGSGSGNLVWNSGEKIYKVEATVLCYANYDSYHEVYIYDSWSHAVLSNEDFDLTYDGQSHPQEVKISKEFESGVNSFELKNQDGRIFLKDLTITWRG